jgi:hypothetical protein
VLFFIDKIYLQFNIFKGKFHFTQKQLSMRRTLKLAVMMLLIVAAFSCQKDEESNTSQIIGRKLKAANDPLFLLDIPTNNWCTQTGTNREDNRHG